MFSFSDDLGVLRTWMASHGLKVSEFVSDRQAAFKAQKLAGTYFKFPPKGHSCRAMMLEIQAVVIKKSADRRDKGTAKPKPGAQPPKPRAAKLQASPADVGLVIFTEGSASPDPGGGGWGFVAYSAGEEIMAKCGGDAETTSALMELEAIALALNFVFYSRRTRPKGCPVRILSDSAYAVGIATKSLRSENNTAIIDCIHWFLEDIPNVSVEWGRGLLSKRGSERANELAEQGRMLAVPDNHNPLNSGISA